MSTKKFNDKRFEFEGCPKLLRGGEFAYIALDSCTVINMAAARCRDFKNRAFKDNTDLNLISNLHELEHGNAIKNGNVCDRGRYVLCIVPAVLEEIDMDGKKYSETIQELLTKSYLKLEIRPEYKAKFDDLTEKIMRDFKNHDLFVNGFGNFMEHDARIAAQAAIFNLTIASQDKHLIAQSNGHREHIKFWSAKHLQGDHNGHQAVPMALCEIINQIRNEIPLPKLENTFFLTDETRKQLERLKFHFDECSRPNPLFSIVQNETNPNKTTAINFDAPRIPRNFACAKQHE